MIMMTTYSWLISSHKICSQWHICHIYLILLKISLSSIFTNHNNSNNNGDRYWIWRYYSVIEYGCCGKKYHVGSKRRAKSKWLNFMITGIGTIMAAVTESYPSLCRWSTGYFKSTDKLMTHLHDTQRSYFHQPVLYKILIISYGTIPDS